MKQCTRCFSFKPFTRFYKQANNSKDGFQSHCKECDNLRVAARKAKNQDRAKAVQAKSDRNKYLKRKALILARNKNWKISNPERMQAADARRRAARLQRTPAWLSDDDLWLIEQAYDIAQIRTRVFGFSWHVDHIVPLQGKLVSGLHVPHNIQVIPAVENCRKANHFTISTT
jgi:hypothetical protein